MKRSLLLCLTALFLAASLTAQEKKEKEEIIQLMKDARAIDTDILTIGQYLPPSKQHYAIHRYYHPSEFNELKEIGLELGFKHVEAGPLVRSSYHADAHVV